MELWGDVGVVSTGLAAVTFCLVYAVTAPWWRSAMGRNVMALVGLIGLFVGLGIIRMIWPNAFDDVPWLRPLAWTLISAALWQRVFLLVRTQVLRRRDERAGQ